MVLTALVAAAVAATPASAATIVGTELPPAPTAGAIGCDPGPWCVPNVLSGVRVPVGGVVTSWRTMATTPTTMALVRMRGTAVEAAQSPVFPYRQQGAITFPPGPVDAPVRLQVLEGDRLSVSWGGTLTGTIPADPASPFAYEVNGAAGFTSTSQPAFQATIEPDADGDGAGDETQDLCPVAAQGACPGFTFVPDAAPAVMPGLPVVRSITVTLGGPGRTPAGTQLFLEGKAGLTATLDGVGCAPLTASGRRRAACAIGAAGPGRSFTLVVTIPGARGPRTSVRIVAEAAQSAGPPIRSWPTAPAAATVSTPVPELDALRPRVRVVSRLQRGRVGVRVSCPTAGTQDCRVRVTLRRAGSGQRTFARGTVRVARGKARTVRLRPSRTIARRLRRGSLALIATATRLDLSVSSPAGSATRRVRAR